MISYSNRDITEVKSGLILHGVNCQNVMGGGVAYAIRKKWPKVYGEYSIFCDKNDKELLGKVNFVEINKSLYIGNLFSQYYYGNDGKKYASLSAIKSGLITSILFASNKDLPIYMPKIGCGLGGLDWETEVRPLVEELITNYDKPINFNVYSI